MSHRVISIYDKATGLLTGRTASGTELTDELADKHLRDGEPYVDGLHDHLSKRVNLKTAEVEDHQPPQPSADHEWNADMRGWRLRADVAEREARRRAALAEIARLEASQHRPLREAVLGLPGASSR